MLKQYKNDLNYLNMFFMDETSDHYLFNVILKLFYLGTGLFLGMLPGEIQCGSLVETLFKGYKSPLFCIS